MTTPFVVLLLIGVGAIFFAIGWLVSKKIIETKIANAKKLAERILSEAKQEAENIKKSRILEAKEEYFRLRQNVENETRQRRGELLRLEKQLNYREINLEKRSESLKRRESELDRLQQDLKERERKVQEREAELDRLLEEQLARLEALSGMGREEAREALLNQMLEKARQEAAQQARDIKEQARLTAYREAREIVVQAIQRTAADHAVETTVSVVQLPNDEMKGRIIGREGRNIRAFEMATGVEVIVDDTPEAVLLSGFDPIRREVAKIALERLVSDGRIHPGRIEDVVQWAKKELEERILEAGEQALMETGVHGIHPELVRLLGKLKYRTSYGQNVLQHSIEVSFLAGLMASELQLDAVVAKRAGLLHDIGKAVDRYTEGTHPQIGLELVRKYGEGPEVQNAVAAHHEDVEAVTPVAVLVQAADAISSSRPGARRETLEEYIKRLQKLEELAKSFQGVQKTYAIQAGREIRVIVEPEKISDAQADQLADNIAAKIKSEMEYPGQIKVTVIREYRAVGIAR